MKKLLFLLFAAAIVGVLVSERRDTASSSDGALAGSPVVESDGEQAARTPILSTRTTTPADQCHAGEVREAPPQVLLPPGKLVAAMEDVQTLLKAGKKVEARAVLSALYLQSRGQLARKTRDLLDEMNDQLVFNPRCLVAATTYAIQPGDTLSKIGRRLGVNWRMIGRINGIRPNDTLRVGRDLKIITGKSSMVAYKGEFRLALLIDGVYVKEYSIGIGLEGRTPVGRFVVDSTEVHPPWYPPGGGRIEYGEEGYLLGERWIGFADVPGAAGLGIHGTHDESTIGTKCSNGCIRMRNDDMVELFDFVQMSSLVEIKE